MRFKVRYYIDGRMFNGEMVEVTNAERSSWTTAYRGPEFWARLKAERELPKDALVIVEPCKRPIEYDCEDCGELAGVRCTKHGSVLPYFHTARRIECGELEPPKIKYNYVRAWMPGTKFNRRSYHEKADNQFDRKKKNRRDRMKARSEVRASMP